MFRMSMLSIAFLILFGCDSDSDRSFSCDSGDEEIVGCWLTECGQLADHDGNPIPSWGTSEISFRANGEMEIQSKIYKNSECTGSPDWVGLMSEELNTTFGYSIGQQATDSNGIEATQIQILLTTSDETYSHDALYFITSDQMFCTSESLRLGPVAFSFSDVESRDIDLTGCIARAE